MGADIDLVNATVAADYGEHRTVPADRTPAGFAAVVHDATYATAAANNAVLYLLAVLVTDTDRPSTPDATAAWVNTHLTNPFPPSLPELGSTGYIDEGFFDAQPRYTWAVAAGVAAVDDELAATLGRLRCDTHGVPVEEIDTPTADAVLGSVAAFVEACAATADRLR